ncbi:MAG: hypothetical protein JXM79_15720 [Sedimentisphaerales bacterium]|nr:hypothetical protein [Sedimentisphaerales bacterium]
MSGKHFLTSFFGLVVVLGFLSTATMGANILFISALDGTEAGADDELKAYMEGLGHTVTYFDDSEDEAATEAAAAAADLVFISESVGSSAIREEITEVEVPMIVNEMWAWDEMGLTNGGGADELVVTTDIEIVNPDHYLAAGLSGSVAFLTDLTSSLGECRLGKGIAGDGATVIATATLADGVTYDILFVYEKGATLPVAPTDGSGQVAADVRICFGFHEFCDPVLTDNAYALLGAAVRYALGPKPKARKPNPYDGAIHENTWVSLNWEPGDFAVSHDVYVGDAFDAVDNATQDSPEFRGNQTSTFFVVGFPGYPYPDGLVPGTTYYWRIDEVNPDDPNSPWKGYVWSFSIPPKTAYNPDPADGTESVDPSIVLTWTPGYGSKLHTVYFGDNFDEVTNATVGVPTGTPKYTPKSLKLAKTYYWRVDEFDGFGTYKGDVWSFTTLGGVGSPNPADGAVGVTQTPILTWSPGSYAASHEVYFGADADAVRNATKASSEYKGTRSLGDESYDPGKLAWETSYYWRIDEVNNLNPDSPWTGKVWSFTTADFAIVDDFEGYTDDDAAGQAVWQSWIDGYGVADNGAQVGYLMPPYAEQTIVHGGSQSMPLTYDNTAPVTNSEAVLTLTNVRDWTEEGVAKLSLWFRGDTANAAEPLYVAVSNATGGPAIATYNDPSAVTTTIWTQWIVPLQTFADQGINLLNVDKIAIGLGSKGGASAGGTGTLYIDDIRLNRP